MRFSFLSLLFAVLVVFSSCEEGSKGKSDDAKVSNFYLVNDSIKGLDKIKFTIDHEKNLIYNVDSADYGMRVDSAFPYIVCSPVIKKIEILSPDDDNTMWDYEVSDTVFLNFEQNLRIRTLAEDNKTEKTYTVNVNVHQVDPDTFIWEGVNSQIYAEQPLQEHTLVFNDTLYLFTRTSTEVKCYISTNGSKWSGFTTNLSASADLYRIVAGYDAIYYADNTSLYASTDGKAWSVKATAAVDNALFCIRGEIFAQKGDKLLSYPEYADGTWTEVATLPAQFPVTGMSVCVAEAANKHERVFVFGGKDKDGNLLKTLWSSDNGEHWVDLLIGKDYFSAREGAAIAQYADGLVAFGGMDVDGLCDDRLAFSADHGLTWELSDSIKALPDLCVDRYYPSMITNSLGYIYVVGGMAADDTYIKNAWRGLSYTALPGFIH